MKRTAVSVIICALIFVFVFTGCDGMNTISFTVSKDNVGIEISQDMYGLFLEDISYAGDGGLVSNLVANGSFEYEALPLSNWFITNLSATVGSEEGLNEKNTKYLKVDADGIGNFLNAGYLEYYDYLTEDYNIDKMNSPDMGFKKDAVYDLSFYIKNIDFEGSIDVGLVSYTNTNDDCKDIEIPLASEGWTKMQTQLVSKASEDGGLLFKVDGKGEFYIDFVSLVPQDSYGYGSDEWKYVTLRSDMVQALYDLSPSFIRFPGGCLAEGDNLENLFSWKNTIGPLEEREQTSNIWNDDENGKAYNNTFALGYHEYFQLCDDLGAKPLPILNVGMICQFEANYNEVSEKYKKGKMTFAEWQAYLDTVALRPSTDEFNSYVQDILDLIEYANGDTTTYWGAIRARNGHPEPFNLKYIGLGNENWGELYWRNFDAIYQVIKREHPEITIISSASYEFEGERIDESWELINDRYPDTVVDEHYYTGNNTLFRNNDRYDSYDRDGAKVFVGEYAATCWGFGKLTTKSNIWEAVEEASYLTGIERNGDIVVMASYAPTFAKINSQCWDVNMIWFDSQNIVLTPSYYVQMLYANNYGTNYVNVDFDKSGVYTSTTVDEEEQVLYIKLVNSNGKSMPVNLDIDGFGNLNAASMQYISGEKGACNELGSTTVLPAQEDCAIDGNTVSTNVDAYSVNVIRIYYGENDGSRAYVLPEVLSTMESNLTEYTGFYVTPETLMAIFIPLGIVIIAGACVALFFIVKKAYKKRKQKISASNGEE